MKSSAVIPDTAMTGSAGARSRRIAMTSTPLVSPRKMSTIAASKGLSAKAFNPAALGLLDLETIDPKHHRDHRADALLVVDNENARHWEQLPIKSSGPNLEPAAAEGHYGTVQ